MSLISKHDASSETQGRLAGKRGNKSGKQMKRRRFTSKTEKAPGKRLYQCCLWIGQKNPLYYSTQSARTHHRTSGAAVRRLGRIIQRIFLPNPEAALVEPFGNGLVRVGSQGLFRLIYFYFLTPQLTAPRSPRMSTMR